MPLKYTYRPYEIRAVPKDLDADEVAKYEEGEREREKQRALARAYKKPEEKEVAAALQPGELEVVKVDDWRWAKRRKAVEFHVEYRQEGNPDFITKYPWQDSQNFIDRVGNTVVLNKRIAAYIDTLEKPIARAIRKVILKES
jgi:hypothetical protein